MLFALTAYQLVLLALYVPLSCALAAYGLHRAHQLFTYLKVRNKAPQPEGELKELPTILIQLPVFNESVSILLGESRCRVRTVIVSTHNLTHIQYPDYDE